MKKLILTSAFLSAFTLSGLAQQNELNTNTTTTDAPVKKTRKELTPEQAAQRQSTKATDELGLNTEQKQKYYDYALARISANRPLKQQAEAAADKATKKKLHQEIKANRLAFDKNLKSMLTAEQATKLEAQRAKNKAAKQAEDSEQD